MTATKLGGSVRPTAAVEQSGMHSPRMIVQWFREPLRARAYGLALGLRHQPARVLRQQVAIGDEAVCRRLDCRHIGFLGGIAFFDREPGIAGIQPLLSGACERDEASLQGAEAVLVEAPVEQVPAGIGSD